MSTVRKSRQVYAKPTRTPRIDNQAPPEPPKPPKPVKPAKVKFDLSIAKSPMAVAFRDIEPNWRFYIEYVRLSAQGGDQEMLKVIKVFDAITNKRERDQIMPEKLCDLAGVDPSVLIGSVAQALWMLKVQGESTIIATLAHPNVIKATTTAAGILTPGFSRDRELHYRAMGLLPDKKGNSINVHVNPQTAIVTGQGMSNLPANRQPSTYVSMEDELIDIDRRLGDGAELTGGEVIPINASGSFFSPDIDEIEVEEEEEEEEILDVFQTDSLQDT